MNAEAKTLAARPRFFFDTEFIEDGKTIELVSIGIAAENGRTYYAEVEGVDYSRADPWLHENVFPHLTGETKPRGQIAAEVAAFVGEKPEFWAYYADYDWVALCQLYGRMIDLPKGWPMFCRDVKQLADAKGNPKLPEQTTTEHHALADAIDTKAKWAILESLSPPDGVGLTRYGQRVAEFDNAFWVEADKDPEGDWVRHEDAAAALAAKEAEAKHWHECWMAEQDLRDKDRAERDALKAALAPFAEALDEDDFADERLLDRDEIWEHPVAMRITFKHLRDAKRAALSPAQGGE